jgi:hypothetical protein
MPFLPFAVIELHASICHRCERRRQVAALAYCDTLEAQPPRKRTQFTAQWLNNLFWFDLWLIVSRQDFQRTGRSIRLQIQSGHEGVS